ncbi:efflux RND transporter permease subunit [Verminephrobacter aporrectodeae subsp. tuberculatae]|uniref:efflux RND transporter permease subunit n=1 Tax=Verminephrobacter aporrectodeae TaxID=1110389 RepID=UPI0022441606|nr:efflux RND transporter permease subunit [Verminephrobacter aporrectodeae]MCW8163565.1 efflux RND transporter permease subunit [Verminephrobacter aporrectodeae subsp. tuberculatae]MCW8167714.1 efflux RND transporter permease subunit [Verminephrobacter aporrectodeae subsp. tuberculatae]MCW8205695.1 efflux RND transporter permease subunit [Verminephrobacter aporrectodeae subsp. tuberculatae]
MNVSAWSIKNPIPALMLFVLLSLGGLSAFNAMKVQNFPDIDLPTITVALVLPGASPAQLESDVVRKVENSLATLQGLKHIYTNVRDGNAAMTAQFRLEKPTQEALDDTRAAVARVRGDLPADLRDPVVTRMDLAGQPVLAFTIASERRDDEALSWLVDDTVAKKLLAVPGVGAVNRVGGVKRQVNVALDPVKLQALSASAADVSRQLRLVQSESAGGRTDLGGSEQALRTLATVQSAQELAGLTLALADGRHVRLDELATVSDDVAEPRALALLDGRPVVGFEVARSKGASELEVGTGVQAALDALRAQHPDLQITKAFDFVQPVQEEYDGSMHLLIEGALLAVLVVWIFLRDWRATFVSAVALPLSVIPAFIGMHFLGFTINVVTLLALSLVVGILVDDAIVEVENIVRHLRMGKTPYQAAMEAADEIGLAVVATTFTLIAVFLPTAFMSGVPGKFFKQFGWTASLAVFASLVVARALTPMMAAYLLRPIVDRHQDPRWMRVYLRWAAWCIRHRGLTYLATAVFFFGSLALIPMLPTGFIPPDDNSQTQVHLELPPGSTLAQMRSVAEDARQRIARVEHVQSTYTTIGGGSAGADPFAAAAAEQTRKATLTVMLSARRERPRKQLIENAIRAALVSLPGVRSKVGLGGSAGKYMLVLSGEDPQALGNAALALEKDLRSIEGLGGIASTASLVQSEIAVRPDFARAADLGVTSSAIAETLRIATVGDYDVSLPQLNLASRQIPIVVKLQDDARQDLALLERLTVPGSKGPVMLGQVATLEFSSGPAEVNRYDRARNVNFEIELADLELGKVDKAVQALPSINNLPPGVRQIKIGDAEEMGLLFASFSLAMLTGVLCIYIVLVLLFKDFLHPVTILAALPLSIGGAFVGLLIAQKSFSMPSLIGLIMLMGIATKNSILLVEYAILARRERGMTLQDALLDACHKRARPIIMTTLAMGAGMLPIALGVGAADPSFRSPMAVAVIGGLITSTLLSLLVIPAVFTGVDDFGQWTTRLLRRLRGKRAHPTAAATATPATPQPIRQEGPSPGHAADAAGAHAPRTP